MKKKIVLDDQYTISDTHSKVSGVVLVKDKNGKILFKKENMIVNGGRQFIKEKIFGTNSATIKGIKVGSGIDRSNESVRVVSSKDYKLADELSSIIIEPDADLTVSSDLEHKYVFKVTLDSLGKSASTAVGELGLFLNDGNDKKLPTMFSRLIFEPFTITSSEDEFNIEYTIYF